MPDTCQVDGCGNPAGAGLSVCPNCVNRLRHALDEIPGLWIDLRITMGRQKAATYNGATAASRETPLPVHLPALLARDALHNTVTAWTRETGLLTGRPSMYDDVPNMARWLNDPPNLHALTRSAAAPEAVEELTQGAIQEAQRVIDTPPGRIYAGPCNGLGLLSQDGTPRQDEVDGCGGTLYVPELDRYNPFVTCSGCGAGYDQQIRRKWVAAQFEGIYVSIAEASVLLGETRKTIQQRVRRNRIKARTAPLGEEPAYLLDDLTTETPTTRTERHLTAKYRPNRYPTPPQPLATP